MGANRLGLKFLLRDKKSMTYLIASMVVGYTALFILFNTYYSTTIQNGASEFLVSIEGAKEIAAGGIPETVIAGIIILCVIFLIGYMGWFINEIALVTRRKEMAIQLLGGVSRPEAMRIAWMQSMVLSIIAAVIAFILGAFLTPLVCKVTFGLVDLPYEGVGISGEGTFISLIIILLQLVAIFLNNGGLCYRNEIVGIIKLSDKDVVPKIQGKASIAYVSVIACLAPIIGLIMKLAGGNQTDYLVFIDFANYVSLFGLVGFGTYSIPYFVDKFIDKFYKYDKEKIITLKNFKYLVSKSVPLYIGYVFIRFLSTMTIGASDNPRISVIGTISLNMMTIIITVALIYRVVFTALKRRKDFKAMLLLGYKKENLTKSIRDEMILYLGIVVLIPMIQLVISVLVYGNVSIYIPFIVAYIILSLVGVLISYVIYKKLVFEYIGVNNEREAIR
ncbi:MAG: FtsX-like permease family protein [Sarcina sp.]